MKNRHFVWPLLAVSAALGSSPASAQMVTGSGMKDFNKTFALPPRGTQTDYRATYAGSSVPGNALLPGEQGRFDFQVENLTDAPLQQAARVELIAYGTRGLPGDIWVPETFRIASHGNSNVRVDVPARGYANFSVAPKVPAKLGGYALVLDMGNGQRNFLTSFVRTFAPAPGRVQFPKFCLEELPLPLLKRLGAKAIRWGVDYKPTTDKDFPQWFARHSEHLKKLQDANVSVLMMVGAGEWYHPNQPLGRPRPWLDENGVMKDTKTDIAWTPDYDRDFQKYTRLFVQTHGWPRGPINGVSLWNEPWEGISISGWGADMLRYREMYRAMAAGVLEARKNGAQVLVGGADSSSNAFDKFFGDEEGQREFLPQFDFLSIHYQGLSPSSNARLWRERKGYNGRVRIWDTESWVANTDDRVASVVASNHAVGYDRAMGTYGGNIAEEQRHRLRTPSGHEEREIVHTWSTASSVGAAQHFIGERKFRQMLFRNGLPWTMQFDGLNGQDDGTLVVVGDLSDPFGADALLHRTARGLKELRRENLLRAQLKSLPASSPQRAKLQAEIDRDETLSGATLTLQNPDGEFSLFDFYGNAVPNKGKTIVVPLDARGFFLRANSKNKGAFARLLNATRSAQISGIEPLATVAHDFTSPIEQKPALKLTLTNVLNRPVRGTLAVQVSGLKLQAPQVIAMKPNETRVVPLRVLSGEARPDNRYALALRFNAGNGVVSEHRETVRANVMSRLTPKVDSDLSDWNGALPQIVSGTSSGPSQTEAAWFPFKTFDANQKSGVATGFLGYDAQNFYFAAKIADSTSEAGMLRFESRDDDQFFYPETSFAKEVSGSAHFSARWSGEIVAPTTGKYTFTTLSDDGVRLFLKDKAVIDNWTDHGPTEDVAIVEMVAGQRVPIRMEFFQTGGGATAKLFWQAPGKERQLVPASALFPAQMNSGINGANVGNGLRGEYFRGSRLEGEPVATRLDAGVNFEWANGDLPDKAFGDAPLVSLKWPKNVRRFSYRTDPELPSGNAPYHDNVQIAFNVLPEARKPLLSKMPGLPPKFTTYADTDYEYALNPVAPQHGGGTEVWRLQVPDMPRKHFYPRQPKWKGNATHSEGAVKNARLVVRRDGNTRFVECAFPWSELPDVKARLDAGQPIKFSFRVNDNNGPALELSQGRSVAKRNASFHADWLEHYANEVEFGWGK